MAVNHQSVKYLVGINVLFFLMIYYVSQTASIPFALYFPLNSEFQLWQLFTYLFIHSSLMHLILNMFGLWMFGKSLEQLWGTKRFLIFYFLSGIGAGLIHAFTNYIEFMSIYNEILALGYSEKDVERLLLTGAGTQEMFKQMGQDNLQHFYDIMTTPAVGASGAIYGILVAYALTFPHVKLLFIFLPVPIKAKYFVPLILCVDLFFGLTDYSLGSIAHFAHLGGALVGFLIITFWRYQAYLFNRR